jgi:protein SCO1/2
LLFPDLAAINAPEQKGPNMQRLIAVGAGIAVIILIAATYVATMTGGEDDVFADCPGSQSAGAVGGPFTLVDENGQTVTDQDVITEPTLLYFGYTFCPDVCPLDSQRNADATDLLAEQGISVRPVFITVDPDRDTPEVVATFTDYFHEKMLGLTGSPEQVAAASRAYKTYYRKNDDDPQFYTVDHSTFTYLVLPGYGVTDFFRRDDTADTIATRTACYAKAAAAAN